MWDLPPDAARISFDKGGRQGRGAIVGAAHTAGSGTASFHVPGVGRDSPAGTPRPGTRTSPGGQAHPGWIRPGRGDRARGGGASVGDGRSLRLRGRRADRAVCGREPRSRFRSIESEGEAIALPAVEIVPDGGFYDYNARYTAGLTEFFCPARISDETARGGRRHRPDCPSDGMGLRDYSRVDLMVTADGQPQFLEVNVAPGMTETSLFPQALEAASRDLGNGVRGLGALPRSSAAPDAEPPASAELAGAVQTPKCCGRGSSSMATTRARSVDIGELDDDATLGLAPSIRTRVSRLLPDPVGRLAVLQRRAGRGSGLSALGFVR